MLYGICGSMGSGKNTVGEILVQNGFKSLSFASTLKDATAAIFGWDRDLLEGVTKESREFRETVDMFWSEHLERPITPRRVLQEMGTEVMRDSFHQDIWLFSLKRQIKPGGNYVITDARFKNEIEFIKGLGGKIVYVERGEKPVWWPYAVDDYTFDHGLMKENYPDVHPSEYSWVGADFDIVIDNNGTLYDLKNKTLQLTHGVSL